MRENQSERPPDPTPVVIRPAITMGRCRRRERPRRRSGPAPWSARSRPVARIALDLRAAGPGDRAHRRARHHAVQRIVDLVGDARPGVVAEHRERRDAPAPDDDVAVSEVRAQRYEYACSSSGAPWPRGQTVSRPSARGPRRSPRNQCATVGAGSPRRWATALAGAPSPRVAGPRRPSLLGYMATECNRPPTMRGPRSCAAGIPWSTPSKLPLSDLRGTRPHWTEWTSPRSPIGSRQRTQNPSSVGSNPTGGTHFLRAVGRPARRPSRREGPERHCESAYTVVLVADGHAAQPGRVG